MKQSAQRKFFRKFSIRGRFPIRALLLTTLALSATSMAQENLTKIGFVDMKRLLDNAPQMVASRQNLEREFAPRDNALKADEARLVELRLRYNREAALMTKTNADELKRKIDTLDHAIKRGRENLRIELKTRSDQELDKSWQVINNAVVEFAHEKTYDLIVPSPVVYASKKVDITDQVLDRLKREYDANKEQIQ